MDNELTIYDTNNHSMVIYHSEDGVVQLEVQLSDETVWLTQKQMSWLFNTSSQNITIHINNVYKERELVKEATCKDFLQVQKEGGLEEKVDFFVRTSLPPVEGVFYNGQIFDAYVFAADLIKSAKESIVYCGLDPQSLKLEMTTLSGTEQKSADQNQEKTKFCCSCCSAAVSFRADSKSDSWFLFAQLRKPS